MQIPIYDTDNSKLKAEIISLVDQLITTIKMQHTAVSSRDVEYIERKVKNLESNIDDIVYKLYQIDNTEINQIIGSLNGIE